MDLESPRSQIEGVRMTEVRMMLLIGKEVDERAKGRTRGIAKRGFERFLNLYSRQ